MSLHNSIVAITLSGLIFVGRADSNCSSADFYSIFQLDPQEGIGCLSNTTGAVWGSTCLSNISETCADALDWDVNDFITNTCDNLDVANSSLPCNAISLGMAMARNAPAGGPVCSIEDADSIASTNMTAVTICANGSAPDAFTCLLNTMSVNVSCGACFTFSQGGGLGYCEAICDTPDFADMCSGCVNIFLSEIMTACMFVPDSTTTTTSFAPGFGAATPVSVVIALLSLTAVLFAF